MKALFLLHSKGIYLTVWGVLLGIGILGMSLGAVGGVWFSSGASVIAAALVAFGTFWASFLTEPLDTTRKHFEEAGLIEVHARRDINTRYAEILRTSHKIDVAGYALRGFFDNHRDLLLEKANVDDAFRLRILMIDPASQTAQDRQRLEEQADAHFAQQLQRMQASFRGIRNIEIKLLQQPLSTMVFRLDDILFFGPYFVTPSSATITFECARGGWAFDKYLAEFETMWTCGVAPPLTASITSESR